MIRATVVNRAHLTKPQTASYTLIEVLIYIAVLVLISIFVVTGLIRLTSAYAKSRNLRHVNEVGALALERIAKEVRKATAITSPTGSTLTMELPMTYAELVKCGDPPTCTTGTGAVAHWDFEETSGTVLADKIGGISATESDHWPTQGEPAVVGKGYLFNGSNNYIKLPDNAFSTHTQGAIEIIYKSSNTQFRALFATARSYTDMVAAKIWSPSGGSHKLNLYRDAGYTATDATFSDASFHHMVMQTTGGVNKTIYVDGVDVTPVSGTGSGWFNNNGGVGYYIGANMPDGNNLEEFFSGVIDEVAIYNEPHAGPFWQDRYNAAFGIASVPKTVTFTLTNGALKISENTGAVPDPISSGKANISSVTFEPVTGPVGGATKTLGVRITVTVSAGSGDTRAEKTFITSAMMRNPQ